MKLGVVILHWGNVEATRRCLASVALASEHAIGKCQTLITIVDNGSPTPFSPEHASNVVLTKVEIVRNTLNLGFSGGMNVGITTAKSRGANAIWLLNNDTKIDSVAIEAMTSYLIKNPNVACIGSVILNERGSEITTVGGYKYQSWLSRATPIGGGLPPHAAAKSIQKFDYVCGSAILLSPIFLRKIERLPDQNFLYFEELYLERALNRHGLTTGVCADARVLHTGGVATSRLGEARRCYFTTLSALRYTSEYRPLCLPTVMGARIARALYLTVKQSNFNIVFGCVRALCHFLLCRYPEYQRSIGNEESP